MIKKIINYIKSKRKLIALKRNAPDMIYGYSQKGKYYKDIRIGSATSIISKDRLEIEDNVFIGQYNFIEASNGIKISEGCQITNYISILTHSSHNSIRFYGKEYRKISNLKGYVKGPVVIGKYTFIGPHVTIMPNTKIGKGCVISAHSFLKGDFPDYSIISGVPAKVVGSTLEKDEVFLKENPELREYYNEWSKD